MQRTSINYALNYILRHRVRYTGLAKQNINNYICTGYLCGSGMLFVWLADHVIIG